MKTTLFVTHEDLDGIAPIILNKFFELDQQYFTITNNYGRDDELKHIIEYDNIIYVDFTPSEQAQEMIGNFNKKCLIIDHHESQQVDMEMFQSKFFTTDITYIYNKAKSGTSLYYDYLKKQGYKGNVCLDQFVELVETYDLFKRESPNWEKADHLNRLLYATGNTKATNKQDYFRFFINSLLYKCQHFTSIVFSKLEQDKIEGSIKTENQLYNTIMDPKNKLFKLRKDNLGNYFVVIKCCKKISAIARKILDNYKKVEYVVILNYFDPENPRISVRSRTINLINTFSELKGHPNACGYQFEQNDDTKAICSNLWNGQKYQFVVSTTEKGEEK